MAGEGLRFFFYGTLMEGAPNPEARWLHSLLEPLGAAQVTGALFALPDPMGWYPALVPGAGRVQGRLYRARPGFDVAALARLDAYEDCGTLYRRAAVDIALPLGAGPAQVYLIDQPLPADAAAIPDGCFASWIARTGNHAYSSDGAA